MPTFTYQHMDPHTAVWTAQFTWGTHSQLVHHNRLSDSSPDWTFDPDAAESWEQEDDTTLVFKLHPGLTFSNVPPAPGRKATSADVKFSIERIGTEAAQFFRQGDFAGIDIETPDDETVVMKLPSPSASFFHKLTTPGTVILPVEVEEVHGTLIEETVPVSGTGPFLLDNFRDEQDWRLVRNPDYFRGPEKPYLDAYEGFFYPNRDAQMVAFRGRDIDVFDPGNLENLNELRDEEGIGLDVRYGMRTQWMVFNTSRTPFDDKRVRQAFSMATPRQEMVDIGHRGLDDGAMLGPGGLNPWVHGPATYSYDELQTRPGYQTGAAREKDMVEARKLLESAGAESLGGRFQYTSQTTSWAHNDTQATLMQDAFREIGLDYTLEPYSYSDTLVNLAGVDFDFYVTPQWANGIDPNQYLSFYFATEAPRNYTKWVHQEYNDLLAQQDAIVDPDERNEFIFTKMIPILEDELPRAGHTNWSAKNAYYTDVHNYYNTYVSNEYRLSDVWIGA